MESTHSRENNPVINLSKAVKDVQNGSNISVAAARHNIPVSILFNRVSAIRQLKEKKLRGEMQSSSNEIPDQYGLIVNEKLFRKKTSRRKYIYVNQLYYNAIHFALEGNSIDDTVLNFKVRKQTLIMKLSEVKAYQNQQSTSNHKPSRNLAERKNEKRPSFFYVMKALIESCSVVLPEKFISAMYDIYKGETFENVAVKFSFDETSFSKVVRMLRVFQKLPSAYIKSKSNVVQSLLPSIHSSFSRITLTKDESLECLQIYFIRPGKRRSYDYETLKTALNEIKNGLSIKQASNLFNIPFSTLRDYAVKMNIYKKEHNSSMKETPPLDQDDDNDVKIMSISPQKSVVCSVKSKGKRSQPLCLFCHQPGYREEEIGKLHIMNKVIVHYYCLLFSCALEQNGDDDEGILGFLPKDIIKEINRGKRLKCSHCGLKGATIGCSYKNCKKVYHFPCGLDSFAQYIFTDNFSSMCSKHRKYQNGQGKGLTMDCPICLESMEADPKIAVWPPCCKRSSWFHKKCIQKLALSAGYFFKCPLCNDKNVFTSEMLRQGIFVPDQDASWELVPNAYQELLERPIRCTAPVCKCPSGRNSDEEGTRWEVLLCYYCGSTGIHIFCGNLKPSSTEWHCPTCVAMLEERSQREQSEVQRTIAQALKRKKCDLGEETQDSSDEERSDGSLSKRKRRSSNRLSQQPSSSNAVSSLDSDIDQIISVPKRVRGHIVIRDLIENNEPLNETLIEMRQYAENLSQKLVDSKIEKIGFLNLINSTNSSTLHSRKRYIINETHLQKFEACSLNYDQMRFLRNVFELGFALSLRKSKTNSNSRASRLNPFCRKKRRYKDVLQVKDSLLNLLIKAKSANLLEEDNTWSSYGNRQKNAYFSKVNNDLPSTSSEREIDTSERGGRSISHSSRSVCPIRLMESDQVFEECMWCNIELVPGFHPTTFKNLKFHSVILSVICTSCLTENIFHNVFSSFATSHPHSSRLKIEDVSQMSTKPSCVENGDRKEIDTESKKNQLKITNYFSPPVGILKAESKEIKPISQSTLKPDIGVFTPKNVDIKENETQNLKNVKQDRKENEYSTKRENCLSSSSIGRSSTLNSSPSTSLNVANINNAHCTSDEETERVASSMFELENVKSEKSDSANKVPVKPEPLTRRSDTSRLDTLLIVKDKDPSKYQPKNSDDSVIKIDTTSSISSNTYDPKVSTSVSDAFKSTTHSSRSSRNENNDSETTCTPKDEYPKLTQILNTDNSKANLESNQPIPSSTTTTKKIDNPDKVNITEKDDTLSSKVPKVTSELRNLRPHNTNSSFKTSSEAKSVTTSDSTPSASTSLRNFRAKESNSSTPAANTNNTSFSDIPARQIILTRSEVLKNMPRHISEAKDFQTKTENKLSLSSVTSNKSKDSPSIIRICETDKSAGPSKVYKIDNGDENSKAEPSKSRNENSCPKVLENPPQSCPPVHQPMNIISSSNKICKGCKLTVKYENLMKKSKIYCPCCKDVPTFCDKSHFDYYHSQTHHWATIPPNDGILRPVRKCRICTKCEFTRFYCPACPGNFGYCSYEHYIQNHKNQKSKDKVEASPSPMKSTSEIILDNGNSKSSGATPKLISVPNLQNLKSKVVPQTLTLSSFNFPSMSRRIYLNEALGPSPSGGKIESLKGVRINKSVNKEDQKKA